MRNEIKEFINNILTEFQKEQKKWDKDITINNMRLKLKNLADYSKFDFDAIDSNISLNLIYILKNYSILCFS